MPYSARYCLYKDRGVHNGLAPTNVEIDEQTKKIKDWLGCDLPAGIFALLKDGKKAFARRLSNAELSMIDLHMVYSHITLLGYNKMLHDNWQDDPTTIPAKVPLYLFLIITQYHNVKEQFLVSDSHPDFYSDVEGFARS